MDMGPMLVEVAHPAPVELSEYRSAALTIVEVLVVGRDDLGLAVEWLDVLNLRTALLDDLTDPGEGAPRYRPEPLGKVT